MRILRAASVAAAVLVLGVVLLVLLAPKRDLVTSIDIAAPPARVWNVLTDTTAYPAWNPLIAGLNGTLEPGQTIENIEGYGDDQRVFWPRILAATPDRELRWFGRFWGVPRLFDAEHYFLLRPTETGTRFIQGERLCGALLWLFDTQQLVPAFDAMNTALKQRVETEPASAVSPAAP